MNNDAIVSKDIYLVVNRTILSDHDRETLIMLYQPVIGAMAINLYFTLWSNLDRSNFTSEEFLHEQLVHSLGISLNSILENRQKLEAVGLIKTYVKTGSVNNYIYELYSPLSPFDVFNNPLLNTALYTNLGKKEYLKIVDYFKIPEISMTGYKNITCNYNDVFEAIAFDQAGDYDAIRKKSINNVEVIPSIDLNIILNMIPDEILNKKSVTKETKDFIYKLSFIYNLDNDSTYELISNSIDLKKTIDKDKLRENCFKFYKFENYGKNPTIIYRTQPESLRSSVKTNSKKSKAIYMFETTSPHDFLLSKYNGASLNKNDTNLLEHLLLDMDLKAGVVNVLIDYVLRINDNKLTRSFVDTIASQWKRSNIETVEDAINLAKKEYQTRQKKNNNQTKEIKPSWMNKTIEVVEASAEEKEQMEELLKEFK
ncbi:MAG: DnaD domain protein [Bacilli bacterium]|nr:DnaD domain protein [Bacilli bacterium]